MEPPVFVATTVNAAKYVVRDIDLANCGVDWCWTGARPELRFLLNSLDRGKFFVDFGMAESTFVQTGPIKVSVMINGHLLGQVACPKPGNWRYEASVPQEWLSAGRFNQVVMEPDKVFVSSLDGAKLGFTLYRAGFLQ
jgi:hypothetical protein